MDIYEKDRMIYVQMDDDTKYILFDRDYSKTTLNNMIDRLKDMRNNN